jgi:hypothetical protein
VFKAASSPCASTSTSCSRFAASSCSLLGTAVGNSRHCRAGSGGRGLRSVHDAEEGARAQNEGCARGERLPIDRLHRSASGWPVADCGHPHPATAPQRHAGARARDPPCGRSQQPWPTRPRLRTGSRRCSGTAAHPPPACPTPPRAPPQTAACPARAPQRRARCPPPRGAPSRRARASPSPRPSGSLRAPRAGAAGWRRPLRPGSPLWRCGTDSLRRYTLHPVIAQDIRQW